MTEAQKLVLTLLESRLTAKVEAGAWARSSDVVFYDGPTRVGEITDVQERDGVGTFGNIKTISPGKGYGLAMIRFLFDHFGFKSIRIIRSTTHGFYTGIGADQTGPEQFVISREKLKEPKFHFTLSQ